jgi:hypothetical protein
MSNFKIILTNSLCADVKSHTRKQTLPPHKTFFCFEKTPKIIGKNVRINIVTAFFYFVNGELQFLSIVSINIFSFSFVKLAHEPHWEALRDTDCKPLSYVRFENV